MLIGNGYDNAALSEAEIRKLVEEALSGLELSGRRIVVIIPDLTRAAPIPLMFTIFHELLSGRVAALDYLVALGTHRLLDDASLGRLVGRPVINGMAGKSHIFNHQWDRPETFVTLGTIPAARLHDITGGLLSCDVSVTINRLVLQYDYIFVCGPTVPHEAVGFSGGNKYFFPGISGPEIIEFTHWLAAVISNLRLIGNVQTPVREIIDIAGSMIDRPKICFSMVVRKVAGAASGLAGLYIGTPEEAFGAAADLSRRIHVQWVDKKVHRVLSLLPHQYADLWTGAKGFFKVEPIVADGGEVILYAPHISELSYSYGHQMNKLGYHVCDYFLKQWDRFKHNSWLLLAHAAYVKGAGQYLEHVENPRIRITLATSIPRERCELVNLGYRDPVKIDVDEWQRCDNEGTLIVPNAGEVVYRARC